MLISLSDSLRVWDWGATASLVRRESHFWKLCVCCVVLCCVVLCCVAAHHNL